MSNLVYKVEKVSEKKDVRGNILEMSEQEKLRILILEDRLADAHMVVQVLKNSRMSFEHLATETKEEFFDVLDEFDPDIILSDYNLVNYNGLSAFSEVRQIGYTCPFILVTGSMPDEIAVECLKAGIDDYILKDRLSRLPDAIQSVMEKRSLEAERSIAIKNLMVSQKRLAEAEHMAKLGNWEWDVRSGKVIWSDEMYRIFEVPKEEFDDQYDSIVKFFHTDDKNSVIEQISKVAAGVEDYCELKGRIITGNDNVKMLHTILKSNKVVNGREQIKVFATVQDITTLHSTEQALRELTEELENKVKERTWALTFANKALAQKNQEMTNSLKYAKLIQRALLSKLAEYKALFPESFVLWMPKDIVSGDFYWHYQKDGMYYIAAVDCTGHGVPGAFMSMIGHQLLNRIVVEDGITEPSEILKELDEGIVKALQTETGREMNDGMDVAFCRVDKDAQELTFAGALRPLFYFNGDDLKEIQGSKYPLGGFFSYPDAKEFQQHTLKYKEGDRIYLSSDGYYSQFGGETGKKMMKKAFANLLSKVSPKPIEEQYDLLKEHLIEWKGTQEQVDDVLVIGIKL